MELSLQLILFNSDKIVYLKETGIYSGIKLYHFKAKDPKVQEN